MKAIKIYFTLFLLVFLGVSCFEDDSNYTYKDVSYSDGSIVVTQSAAIWGKPIVITPKSIDGSAEGVYKGMDLDSTFATRMTWKYFCPELTGDPQIPICTTMVFNMDLWKHERVAMGTANTILLQATDSLGNVYDTEITVKYDYLYKRGWFVLTNEEGQSVLSLVDQSNVLNHDIRTLSNLPVIGSGPKRMFRGPDGTYIVQESGMVALNENTWATAKTLPEMFQNEEVPEGLFPVYVGRIYGSLAILVNEDGKLYSKVYQQNKYDTEKFSKKTVQYNGVDLYAHFVFDYWDWWQTFIVYSENLKGFYGVNGAWLYIAGTTYPILGPEWNEEGALPNPDDLSGYAMIHAGIVEWEYGVTRSIIRDTATSEIYFYQFDFDNESAISEEHPRAYDLTFIKVVDGEKYFSQEPVCCEFTPTDNYLFFVPGNAKKDLCYLDCRTGLIGVFHSFEDDITCMKFQNESNTVLGVATAKKLYVLNVDDSRFEETDMKKKITQTFDFSEYGGDIVSIFRK